MDEVVKRLRGALNVIAVPKAIQLGEETRQMTGRYRPLPPADRGHCIESLAHLDRVSADAWRRVAFTTCASSLSFSEAIVLDRLIRGGGRRR